MPKVILIGGPNGAGKSTAAPILLKEVLKVAEFVNADVIAQGLSAFATERVALAAGKIMIRRLRELALARRDFAFETTLASRSFAPWIGHLREAGYHFHLIFLSLPNAGLAVARVRSRVLMGGHAVQPTDIRRRFEGGLRNFFSLYLPLADTWEFYDNSADGSPRLIASNAGVQEIDSWLAIRRKWEIKGA